MILDIIHVVEYVWKAAHVFHREGSPELSHWAWTRVRSILEGKATRVAASMRRAATVAGFSRDTRKPVDTCADYLLVDVGRRPSGGAKSSRSAGLEALGDPGAFLSGADPGETPPASPPFGVNPLAVLKLGRFPEHMSFDMLVEGFTECKIRVPSFEGPIKGVMGRLEKAKEPEAVRRAAARKTGGRSPSRPRGPGRAPRPPAARTRGTSPEPTSPLRASSPGAATAADAPGTLQHVARAASNSLALAKLTSAAVNPTRRVVAGDSEVSCRPRARSRGQLPRRQAAQW